MGNGDPRPIRGAGRDSTNRGTNDDAADSGVADNDAADSDAADNDAADSDGAANDAAGIDATSNDATGSVKANGNSLSLLYTNAQSLVNKVNELRIITAINNPDIIIITETWTNDSISNDFLGINGYELIERKDRNDTLMGRGGGICVYVRKCMYAWKEECQTLFNQCGMIGMKRDNRDLHILAVYRSPNSTKTNDDNLCAFIEKMTGSFLIVGDFNFPDIKWRNGSSGAKGRRFLETIEDKFMTQHVDVGTHNSGNILDLVISSQEELVREVNLIGKLGKSDHEMMVCELEIDIVRSNDAKLSRNFNRADCDEMRKFMKRDWKSEIGNSDVNRTWSIIKKSLETVIEKYVPMKKKKRTDEPKWLDAELRNKIEAKRRAWSEWRRTGREIDRMAYKKAERESKRMIRNKKNALERNISKNRTTNPKMYYSYVNSAKKNRSRIGPLKNDDGDFVIKAKEQAETMSRFFSSVFTRSGGEIPTKEPINGNVSLGDVDVTVERVKTVIDGLREYSAPGPDGFPPKLLKILRDEISLPLSILFRKSIDDGAIPDEWRDAHVTAIHKKGSKADPGNYRGVSLTCVIGKMLERLVKEALDVYVERNGLMSNSQHGFRRGRSPQSNLIEFLNCTTKWHDEGKSFDVVYLDFRKAFDVVCHKRLIVKLEAIGIRDKLLRWIKDWLSKRRQRVVVEGEFSEWVSVDSSVLQGSVLGGILFNIFIDDIDLAVIEALIRKFADDTKMAMVIQKIKDAEEMQRNLDRLCLWAEKWKLEFNTKKCKVMHFGARNLRYVYTMNGLNMESVSEEKDLGVWMEEDSRPSKQCKMAAQSANWALGQMTRAFHYRKASCLVPLYKSFVRPKLEHAIAAWSPWTEGDKETLERVQKRMVRMISDKRGNSYEDRLHSIGLTTLAERRERGDAIETYKTLKGVNNVDKYGWFSFRDANMRATRSTVSVGDDGQQQQQRADVLFMESVRLDSRKNFFTVRTVNKWNELPDEIKCARSVNSFKNGYDDWKKKQRQQQQQQ